MEKKYCPSCGFMLMEHDHAWCPECGWKSVIICEDNVIIIEEYTITKEHVVT